MDNAVIEIKNITFAYGKKIVLKECTVNLYEHNITALLGTNGQGKTTLIKCILNYLKPFNGKIDVYGKDIQKYTIQDLSKNISYVPQSNTVLYDTITRDYIVEGRTPYLGMFSSPKLEDYRIVERYAEMLGITEMLSDNIQHLSGGQLQMVMVARALVQETPIIIMDEPMAALDLSHQAELMKLFNKMKRLGKTILFTTHNPNHALALKCNVWIMKDKKIACSGYADEILNMETLNDLYGQDVVVIENSDIKSCSFKSF